MDRDLNKLHKSPQSSSKNVTTPHLDRLREDMIAQYVGLSLCLHIKKELGLEAMLEYMHRAHVVIGERCPVMRHAMGQVLNRIDIKQHFEVMRSSAALD